MDILESVVVCECRRDDVVVQLRQNSRPLLVGSETERRSRSAAPRNAGMGCLAAAHKGEAFIRLVSAVTKLSIDELAVSPPTQGLHFEGSDTGS
jgi:hypothetical protein